MSEDSDWLRAIQKQADKAEAEFAIDQLQPGDQLIVVTQHTTYRFAMITNREAELETGRKNRPSGRVQIQGCAFGASESIKPGHLFCGGSLEFRFVRDGVSKIQRTTPIVEIRHLRGDRPVADVKEKP
jgi:hypothetical protein